MIVDAATGSFTCGLNDPVGATSGDPARLNGAGAPH